MSQTPPTGKKHKHLLSLWRRSLLLDHMQHRSVTVSRWAGRYCLCADQFTCSSVTFRGPPPPHSLFAELSWTWPDSSSELTEDPLTFSCRSQKNTLNFWTKRIKNHFKWILFVLCVFAPTQLHLRENTLWWAHARCRLPHPKKKNIHTHEQFYFNLKIFSESYFCLSPMFFLQMCFIHVECRGLWMCTLALI